MLKLDTNSAAMRRKLAELGSKHIPYAAREAINATAFHVRRGLQTEMDSAFDRPTPFIRKGLWVTKATKKNLSVKVWANTNGQGAYDTDDAIVKTLTPHIFGGPRKPKGFEKTLYRKGLLKRGEYMVPGRSAPRDRYGNVKRGEYQKMLSQIGAFSEQGTQQNARTSVARRRYMWGTVSGTKGIWRVAKDRWIPYFIVVPNAPRYKQRYDFYGVGRRIANYNLPREVSAAVDKVMAGLR